MIVGAPDWPEERLWAFRIGFPVVRGVCLALAPARAEGWEHVPRSGAFIVVSNHIAWMDPPWIEFVMNRAIRFMAKHEVFDIPIVGWALRAAGCFPVRRGASDRRALVTALRVLEAGQPLGFFPEGHRSDTGALIRAHPGIGLLAKKSGAPILPIGVTGTREAKLGRFWRRDVHLRFGPTFSVRDLGAGDDQEIADAIMRRIAALLPREMHGVYA